jgi:flavodoxin
MLGWAASGAGASVVPAASPRAQAAPARGTAQATSARGAALVAFLSRTGNTRVVAAQIARSRGADLFEIRTAQPYPEDYRQTVEQAARETQAAIEPALLADVPDIARYRTVYLGFPIWGMTAPPPVRSFLARHDLAGKVLVPFITHGGYGTGSSLSVMASLAPGVRIADAFVMQADQERDTLERVARWLEHAPARRP